MISLLLVGSVGLLQKQHGERIFTESILWWVTLEMYLNNVLAWVL